MEVWKFEEMKKNPKILDLNKCDDLGNRFLLKRSKNPLIPMCESLKISGNKKSKNPWSSRVWKSGKENPFWKNQKIL